MTDSTTNTQSADSGFDVGSSVDDLFGEIASESESDGDQWTETDSGDESDAVEDQTAADVFDQLRTNADDEGGADDILADESPDDIIASADEPDTTIDADLLADDDELADLLLTGRSKEADGEFLWIDPDTDDAGTSDGDADQETDASVTDDTNADSEDSPSPSDTGTETDSVTPSTTDISSDDDLEVISDSSDETETNETNDTETDEQKETDSNADVNQHDDVESDLEGDDTTSGSVTDGNAEEESDRTDDGSSGPLSKVRTTLGGLF